jgi:hypothetical protein
VAGTCKGPSALQKRFHFALESPLNQHLLLVSGNESVFLTKVRYDTLGQAGYRTVHAESLRRAFALVFSVRPDLIILEESFTEREKNAFIEFLNENYPGTQMLFLQHGDVQPEMLLKACRDILSAQPGSRTVHIIQEFAAKKLA